MSETPPYYSTVQDITANAHNLFAKLYQICDDLGFKEHARKSYCRQAHRHLTELMEEMIQEAEMKKQELSKVVNDMLKEVESLSMELRVDPKLEMLADYTLVDKELTLQSQLHDLKEIKEQRLRYLDELLQKEHEICRSMGAQPIGKNDEVPSNEELESFKLYLERQQEEKDRLENTFKEIRRNVVQLMDELRIEPTLAFEILVYKNPEQFVYTPKNMMQLRKLQDNLKEHLESAREQAKLKREELAEIWKCLEMPEDRCQALLDKYSGHSVADIYALNEEVKRCKQIRSENIERYVEKVREQLRHLWDKCRFDEVQRSKFKPYYVQTYTENLLTLHDLEVERLRAYYNKNKKIYDLLIEIEKTWEKGLELYQRANDPERLYNRGGQLLAEEKQRNAIQKKLLKLDEQLRQLVEDYEAKNNEPFVIDGKSYNEYHAQSWENYRQIKDTLKKERTKAKLKDNSMKKTPSMSTSRRTPATASSLLRPGYTSTRKTPNSPRLVHTEKPRTTVVASRVRRSGRLPRRLLAGSKALNRSNRSLTKQTEAAPEAAASTEAITTIGSVSQYEQFQQHLENRDELRSSMLPENVLRLARSKSQTKMRTPVKTPVKPLRKNLSAVGNTPNKTPKSSHVRDHSRSPRLMNTPRLATASNNMPLFF